MNYIRSYLSVRAAYLVFDPPSLAWYCNLAFVLLLTNLCLFFFFFFQAEDGIRDHCVTGVQTCALPISYASPSLTGCAFMRLNISWNDRQRRVSIRLAKGSRMLEPVTRQIAVHVAGESEIGRASCRERV